MPNLISQYLGACEALLEQNGVSEGSNEGYSAYLRKLRTLSEKIDGYFMISPEAGGVYPYPSLTGEDISALRGLYADVLAAGDAYRKRLEDSGEIDNPVSGARLDLMRQVGGLIGNDYTALSDAAVGKTLPEVLDNSRGYRIDLTGRQFGAVGANMSERIPVSFTDKNGQERRGFFTAAATYEGKKEREAIVNGLYEKYPDAGDRRIITALIQSSSLRGRLADSANVIPYVDNIAKTTPYPHVFDSALRGLVARKKATADEIDAFIAKVSVNGQFTTDIANYFIDTANYQNREDVFDTAGIAPGSGIEQRNAAMSSVADLLGVPQLLARSVKMEIKNGDETLSGVFMEFAPGSDRNRLKPDDPLRRCDMQGGRNFDNPAAFRQIADLQVLDYVCGNIDRHIGNMFYQFDETDDGPLLSGIVGIDNDCSFGTVTSKKTVNCMVGPKRMLVISESMAHRVSSLSRDMLEITLKNYGLSSAEIDAAWTRVCNIKEELEAGTLYFREHPDEKLAAGMLRVVRDDEWERYSYADLSVRNVANGDPDNSFNRSYFCGLESIPRTALSVEEDAAAEQELNAERGERIPELLPAARGGMAHGVLLDPEGLNAAPYTPSVDYGTLMTALRSVREKVTLLTAPDTRGAQQKLTEKDIEDLKGGFRELSEIASEHIASLPEHPDPDQKIDRDWCEAVRRSAMRDYLGLENARPGQTLEEIFSAAGTRAVDITGRQLRTVGNALSSRNPLTITGEDGNPVKGFFTRRKTLDMEREGAALVSAFSRKYPQLEDKAREMTAVMTDENVNFAERRKRRDALLRSVSDPGQKEALAALAEHAKAALTQRGTYMAMAADGSGAPIDTRNVAMSRVADLLGCGTILARSVPMKLVDNDREIEGTFMYNAQGSDIDHLKPGDPILNIKADALDYSPALRQLSDITVLDFICMNIDRHPGNMFYQVDAADPEHPKITGITGIDNDMSFGGLLFGEGVLRNQNTSGLDGITNMSASMEARVRALNPDTLRLALDGTGLGDAHLDLTLRRVDLLKQKLDRGEITVIPDDEFARHKLEELLPGGALDNAFTSVRKGMKQLINGERLPEAPKEAARDESLDLVSLFDRNSLAQDIAPVAELNDGLELAERWVFGGSPQYGDVRTSVGKLSALLSSFRDPDVTATDRDADRIMKAYENVRTACEAYLERKTRDGHINDGPDTKPGRRVAAVRRVLEFCNNRTAVLDRALYAGKEEDELRREADRRQDEAFRSMQPRELGTYIKNMNRMAAEARAADDRKALSGLGGQISAASAFALRQKYTPHELGMSQQDYRDAVRNIENGRRANAALNAPAGDRPQDAARESAEKAGPSAAKKIFVPHN